MARVRLTATARTELLALPRQAQDAVADALDLLAVEPREYGYPLLGRLSGVWSCRVPGNYRITYKIRGRNDSDVIIYTIRPRARAYI